MFLSTLLISSVYSWLDFESEIYSILNVTNVESTIHNIFYCHEHDSFKSWTLHAVHDVMSQSLVIAFIRWKSSRYFSVENVINAVYVIQQYELYLLDQCNTTFLPKTNVCSMWCYNNVASKMLTYFVCNSKAPLPPKKIYFLAIYIYSDLMVLSISY